jgi:hypothetical protein
VEAAAETKPVCLRLPRQDGACRRHASRRTSRVLHYYSTSPFVQRSWDGDVESLMYFDSLRASCSLL